jgi:hypothetical protein
VSGEHRPMKRRTASRKNNNAPCPASLDGLHHLVERLLVQERIVLASEGLGGQVLRRSAGSNGHAGPVFHCVQEGPEILIHLRLEGGIHDGLPDALELGLVGGPARLVVHPGREDLLDEAGDPRLPHVKRVHVGRDDEGRGDGVTMLGQSPALKCLTTYQRQRGILVAL